MKRHALEILALMLSVLAATAGADEITLLSLAGVEGDEVRLADVARLSGKRAEALGEVVVAKFTGEQTALVIELSKVRELLTKQEVNWGLLSLGGYHRCSVERQTAAAAPVPALAQPARPVDLTTTVTLRQMLTERIEQDSGYSRANLVIQFGEADRARLDASVLGRKLEIEPMSRSSLGKVPFTVREWSDGSLVRESRMTADVAARALAVVASRSIQRGTVITREDVQVGEVLLRAEVTPMTQLEQVVGQSAGSIIRKGTAVTAEHLAAPVLVRRGDLLEIRGVFGGVAVKLAARAREEGGKDQVILARRDGSREDIAVRIIGAGRAVAVNLAEGFDVATGKVAVQ